MQTYKPFTLGYGFPTGKRYLVVNLFGYQVRLSRTGWRVEIDVCPVRYGRTWLQFRK